VDLPRNFNYLSDAVIQRADKILIVTQLGVPFIRNANRILDYLTQMGTPSANVELVLNRCQADFANITPQMSRTFRKADLWYGSQRL